jgi:hypothetical protein
LLLLLLLLLCCHHAHDASIHIHAATLVLKGSCRQHVCKHVRILLEFVDSSTHT